MKITKEMNDSKFGRVFSHRIEENCSAMVKMCFNLWKLWRSFIVKLSYLMCTSIDFLMCTSIDFVRSCCNIYIYTCRSKTPQKKLPKNLKSLVRSIHSSWPKMVKLW